MAAEGKQPSASLFVVGGEALAPSTVRLWQQMQPDVRIVNEYGPTETVVGCVVTALFFSRFRARIIYWL